MGEAKRRGTLDDRKRQAIDAEKIRQEQARVAKRDSELSRKSTGASATRSKKSMNMAIAAAMAIAAVMKP